MVQLREKEPQFAELGFQIIAISPDQPSKIRKTVERHKIGFTLLSDSLMDAASAFGIAYKVDDATLKALTQYGVDLKAWSGDVHHLLPVPAVFVVSSSGAIQFEYVNPDYSVRAEPDLLLTAARLARK